MKFQFSGVLTREGDSKKNYIQSIRHELTMLNIRLTRKLKGQVLSNDLNHRTVNWNEDGSDSREAEKSALTIRIKGKLSLTLTSW